MTNITEEERKEIVQAVLDRLMYCKGYKEEIMHLNAYFDPKKDAKFTTDISKFKFPLETVIN